MPPSPRTWADAKAAWPLHSKGARTKAARWFQTFAKERTVQPYWGVMEMVMYYIGSHEGWASAFDAGDNVIELDLDEEGPLAAGGSTGGVTLTTSADKVPARVGVKNSSGKDALFEKCDGYLHVGYMIYRNQGLRALWICLSAATKPIEEEHSSTLMSHKTNDGSLDWSCNMSMGTNVTYLNRVLGTLIDADTLVEACLQEGSFYGQMGFHSRDRVVFPHMP